MITTVDVRIAAQTERDHVVETLLLAFVNDPMTRWTFRTPSDYLTYWPELIRGMGGIAFDFDTAYIAGDFEGAALWLPPGVHADVAALDELFRRSVSPRVFDISMRIFEQMERHHPTEPYWHLPLLGVDPAAQGRGLGSALLKQALEEIDAAGQIAALESTNPANVPLYERHGFEITGTIQVEDAPPLTAMVRRPR